MGGRQSRRLGSFERAEVLTGEHFAFNVVVVLRLSGALGDEALRGALDEVQSRHALLRAVVAGSGRRRRFEPGTGAPIPLRAVARDGENSWCRVVEEELGTPFDIGTGPLLRAVSVGVADGGSSELVLTLHHAIVDAVSIHHVLQELILACSGEPLAPPPDQVVPASADELFPPTYQGLRRWPASLAFLARQAADETAYILRTRGRRHSTDATSCRCRVLSLALEEDETAALVRATRRRRVGVFGALSAAMLLAVVKRHHGDRAGPQRYFAFPLLRPYLQPPVESDVVAGYLTTLRLTARVEPARGLWPLADLMHRQVDRAAKRGERFLASRWSAASMRLLLGQRQRMAATALNYAGATRFELGAEAPFAIEGFHAFVTDFLPGPEYTGQARIFRRRLWWDLVYLDVDFDRREATAIAEEMWQLLLDAVAQEEGS